MATDIAEFVGAAIGLNLLFSIPLPVAAMATAVLSFGVLSLQRRGHRRFELAIATFLAFIGFGLLYTCLKLGPSAAATASGLLPRLPGSGALLLAVGIVGATVMPHAIYLHSGITTKRVPTTGGNAGRVLRWEKVDIGLALGLAGIVNVGMLAIAARLFTGVRSAATLGLAGVHLDLQRTVGGGAALGFAVALLASGLSSSSVGTRSGAIVMSGFTGRQWPLWWRRLLAMTPAIVLLCCGVNPTTALIISQVVLCFGVPCALVPLIRFTSDHELMGERVNGRFATATLVAVAVVLIALNAALLALIR